MPPETTKGQGAGGPRPLHCWLVPKKSRAACRVLLLSPTQPQQAERLQVLSRQGKLRSLDGSSRQPATGSCLLGVQGTREKTASKLERRHRGSRLGSQHPRGSSHTSVAPVLGGLTHSFGLLRHETHTWHTDTCTSKTLKHIN